MPRHKTVQASRETPATKKTIPQAGIAPLPTVPVAGVSSLKVDSFEELMSHESEILERISRLRNGGNLFITHPFMLFEDIGVELSERAREEILDHEPHLSALSPTPYNALKESQEEQHIHFHIKGLFRKEQR